MFVKKCPNTKGWPLIILDHNGSWHLRGGCYHPDHCPDICPHVDIRQVSITDTWVTLSEQTLVMVITSEPGKHWPIISALPAISESSQIAWLGFNLAEHTVRHHRGWTLAHGNDALIWLTREARASVMSLSRQHPNVKSRQSRIQSKIPTRSSPALSVRTLVATKKINACQLCSKYNETF